MGPIQDSLVSWWQLVMLRIGQCDKMLRDLRKNKGRRDPYATSLQILVGGENQNVSRLVFSLHMSQ